jgi:hypothetical protein
MTVIRNAMLFLHIGKRDDIRDAIGMEPYCSVPREVTNEICCRAAGLRRELHVSLHPANVREQFWIVEKAMVRWVQMNWKKHSEPLKSIEQFSSRQKVIPLVRIAIRYDAFTQSCGVTKEGLMVRVSKIAVGSRSAVYQQDKEHTMEAVMPFGVVFVDYPAQPRIRCRCAVQYRRIEAESNSVVLLRPKSFHHF